MIAWILYKSQNKILYHPVLPGSEKDPAKNPPKHPGEWGMPYEDVTLEAEDGTHLHAWFMKQPNPDHCPTLIFFQPHPDHCPTLIFFQPHPDRVPTLIFFQENAGNMGLRLPSMHELWSKLRVNVFMVSYRGYGRSEGAPDEEGLMLDAEAGAPDEEGLMLDAEAALLYVVSRPDVDAKRILVHGRSLGGAVGCFVAEQYPEHVKGLILENTFTSIADMVDVVLPGPMDYFVAERYPGKEKGLILENTFTSIADMVDVVLPRYPSKKKGLVLENTFTSIADMVDVVLSTGSGEHNTFTSIADMGDVVLPWVAPLKNLVLRIGWRSIDRIPNVTAPILFISGSKDELVPPEHMRRLHDAASKSIGRTMYKSKSIGRTMYKVADGMHNDTCYRDPPACYCDPPAYAQAYKEWMQKINA
ncbi:Alpha/Beta hydrolase protein [Baffinella frigidus]|nr:Alpha/Beta hydrolase protein [Cryptophyta sp. CCMP2293]